MGIADLFRGELVELRAIDRAHLDAYARWFRDPEVMEGLIVPVIPVTREDEDEWYEQARKAADAHTFGIHVLDDGALIGNCGVYRVDQRSRRATFGIVIGEKEYWDRGYGTDAARVILRMGFEELNLHRIELEVLEFNERGIAAYTKAGFRNEGRRREAVFRNGRYWDLIGMGILSEEWREGSPAEPSAQKKGRKPVRRPPTRPGRGRPQKR